MSIAKIIAQLVECGETELAEEVLALGGSNDVATAATFSKAASMLSHALKLMDDATKEIKKVKDPKFKEEVELFTSEVKPVYKMLVEWIKTFRIV